jgi:hypothetical protein
MTNFRNDFGKIPVICLEFRDASIYLSFETVYQESDIFAAAAFFSITCGAILAIRCGSDRGRSRLVAGSVFLGGLVLLGLVLGQWHPWE